MNLSYSKKALIEALEARRAWAVKFDADAAKKHAADEKAYLAAFKANCREALKWDYQTASNKNFAVWNTWTTPSRPACPQSAVFKLDRALEVINRDGRTRYNVTGNGHMATVHWLLTHNEVEPPEVCK